MPKVIHIASLMVKIQNTHCHKHSLDEMRAINLYNVLCANSFYVAYLCAQFVQLT